MPGTVLLLAAAPAGKGCLVDAASVLPVLAAVPPGVLSGTDTANVVELADPLEPQAVLTRLRAAAAAPGPLTVFVTGQLQLDRRQRLPHLALARTTPTTVRYTGLPWHWIREELRLRAPGTATLILDLHADPEMWEWLRSNPLDAGRTVAVYGRIAPPPSRRTVGVPAYMKAVATILRAGWRPEVPQLHEQALARVGVGGYGDLVLASGGVVAGVPGGFAPRPPYRPEGPRPQTPDGLKGADRGLEGEGDPHSAISAAVQSGRHPEADALAARHEQVAVRAHGPGSEEALHWAEVRADLAMFAGDPARSCRTWLGVAAARLAAGQAPDGPAVESAVDRAHHQWGQVQDAVVARELGASLAELRSRVPGRRQGALDHVRRQLRQLQTQG
ncbi:hypothetical protein LXH13_20125 [Streptomyces spinosirectus]|jgi:hypothetical protein|uniref:hypothetical protein n=1 Tax=Streptomyces TaxID=1883 RepID=UPI000D37633A|nr:MULTISPECIES: hypothetical protein [Streptomyces]MBY8342987.1 hypothetical protein [Streptomyces plumbidurans]PTM95706.1 hypothetical protein C7821_105229 [Streptomyces sp. VMFN-G11Ma]UIR19214.1 hypothetical protein LXH13_20125 [Streptomyces spinosirectus]